MITFDQMEACYAGLPLVSHGQRELKLGKYTVRVVCSVARGQRRFYSFLYPWEGDLLAVIYDGDVYCVYTQDVKPPMREVAACILESLLPVRVVCTGSLFFFHLKDGVFCLHKNEAHYYGDLGIDNEGFSMKRFDTNLSMWVPRDPLEKLGMSLEGNHESNQAPKVTRG